MELMVGIAIVAILLGVGVPSMRDWMIAQRVASVAGELVTDMRYARAEAISSNLLAGVIFRSDGRGCYTVYKRPPGRGDPCDCTAAPGLRCSPPVVELKTVVMPDPGDVSIIPPLSPQDVAYQAGGMLDPVLLQAGKTFQVNGGGTRKLNILASADMQHPTVCVPSGAKISGFKSC